MCLEVIESDIAIAAATTTTTTTTTNNNNNNNNNNTNTTTNNNKKKKSKNNNNNNNNNSAAISTMEWHPNFGSQVSQFPPDFRSNASPFHPAFPSRFLASVFPLLSTCPLTFPTSWLPRIIACNILHGVYYLSALQFVSSPFVSFEFGTARRTRSCLHASWLPCVCSWCMMDKTDIRHLIGVNVSLIDSQQEPRHISQSAH